MAASPDDAMRLRALTSSAFEAAWKRAAEHVLSDGGVVAGVLVAVLCGDQAPTVIDIFSDADEPEWQACYLRVARLTLQTCPESHLPKVLDSLREWSKWLEGYEVDRPAEAMPYMEAN